jgi:hypothetical protein
MQAIEKRRQENARKHERQGSQQLTNEVRNRSESVFFGIILLMILRVQCFNMRRQGSSPRSGMIWELIDLPLGWVMVEQSIPQYRIPPSRRRG